MFFDPQVAIGSDKIKRVTTTKTIGVIIDENITWKNRVDNICRTVTKGIGIPNIRPQSRNNYLDRD